MTLTASNKFAGEQDDRYGGKLQWPGANGMPSMGDAAPSMKQHEIDALPVMGATRQRVFDLNDENARTDYNWVRDRIRNGMFVRDYCKRRWPEDKVYPIIYMEWTQCYVQSPKQTGTAGRKEHGSSRQFTLPRPGGG